MAKPKPVAKLVVCSECGLAWDRHTAGRKTDPTPDVCVGLLKADLAKRPSYPNQIIGTNGFGYGINWATSFTQ